jgi:hypothetical protein
LNFQLCHFYFFFGGASKVFGGGPTGAFGRGPLTISAAAFSFAARSAANA